MSSTLPSDHKPPCYNQNPTPRASQHLLVSQRESWSLMPRTSRGPPFNTPTAPTFVSQQLCAGREGAWDKESNMGHLKLNWDIEGEEEGGKDAFIACTSSPRGARQHCQQFWPGWWFTTCQGEIRLLERTRFQGFSGGKKKIRGFGVIR